MRWILSLWLILLFACFAEVNVVRFARQNQNLHLIEKEYPIPAIFNDYEFQVHEPDTLIEKHEVKSVNRNIGVFLSHGKEYHVFTSFKRIILANGLRGKSLLGFISSDNDSILYDAEMPENLPVDIYKNHFVFQRADGSYSFQKLDTLNTEICCFDSPICCMMRD